MKICMIGTGYVGLVSGTCFAEMGNQVICVDIDQAKIEQLQDGGVPIYEPGLEEMIHRNLDEGRLRFTTGLVEAVQQSRIIFIAVGTPAGKDGLSDLSYVLQAARDVAGAMNGRKILVNKSTAPVGTAEMVRAQVAKLTSHPFEVVSNPEFLKEGAAIDDFLRPDRVVIGTDDPQAGQEMRELYAPFTRTGAPVLVMDTRSAEMSKYASNAMLACRISFMNEVANLCEQLGADVSQVRNAVGADKRIGRSFLFPGVGYGGSCFPKDIQALIRMGKDSGYPLELIETIEKVNQRQKTVLVGKIDRLFSSQAIPVLEGLSTRPDGPSTSDGPLPDQLRKLAYQAQAEGRSASFSPEPATLSGRTFAVWGLSFKPRTDDMREAPSLGVISNLLQRGAAIRAYDPEAMNEAQKVFGDSIRCCENNYQALRGADALILITEWNVFRNPDFNRIKRLLRLPVIFDGRNQYNPAEMNRLGFLYFGIGTR